MNGEGFALGRLVARGWLSGPDALSALWFGAVGCWYERDHGERATVAAIRHALVDGMAQPYPDLGPPKPEASVVVSVTELLDGRGDPA